MLDWCQQTECYQSKGSSPIMVHSLVVVADDGSRYVQYSTPSIIRASGNFWFQMWACTVMCIPKAFRRHSRNPDIQVFVVNRTLQPQTCPAQTWKSIVSPWVWLIVPVCLFFNVATHQKKYWIACCVLFRIWRQRKWHHSVSDSSIKITKPHAGCTCIYS